MRGAARRISAMRGSACFCGMVAALLMLSLPCRRSGSLERVLAREPHGGPCLRLRGGAKDDGTRRMVLEAYSVWQSKRKYVTKLSLNWVPKYNETDVGIKKYTSKLEGIGGVMKGTLADFIVHECRLSDAAPVTLYPTESKAHSSEGAEDAGSEPLAHNISVDSTPGGQQKRVPWVKFVLCKMGLDTITAVRRIASECGLHFTMFRFAGIKDKYGLTFQEVTARGAPLYKLMRINKSQHFKHAQIKLGSFSRCSDSLHSGELFGNRFIIVLRNITASRSHALKAVSKLSKRGFVNYYGMQRFGAGAVPSVEAGLALMKNEHSKFAELLLSPDLASLKEEREAKLSYAQDGDVAACLRRMPEHCTNERLFLEALKKGKTVAEAVTAIPFYSMYMQSYSSAVWNDMCSKRLERYGSRSAVEGDIVLLRTEGGGALGKKIQYVKILTQEEAESGRFSIFDVVLPMVGDGGSKGALIPNNRVGAWLRKRLKSDGIWGITPRVSERDGRMEEEGVVYGGQLEGETAEDSNGHHEQGSAGKPSANPLCKFRPILSRPMDLKYAMRTYKKPDELLFLEERDDALLVGESEGEGEGQALALILAFTLQAGSFATMLVRELTKADTSQHSHFEAMQRLLYGDAVDKAHSPGDHTARNRKRRRAGKKRRADARRKEAYGAHVQQSKSVKSGSSALEGALLKLKDGTAPNFSNYRRKAIET